MDLNDPARVASAVVAARAETPLELIEALRARGIRLWMEGGRLRYDAPAGALDDDLRARVAAQRAQIVELLTAEGDGAPTPLGPAPRGEPRQLSSGQQRLWFLNQLAPDDLAYNVPATVRLRGSLDAAALGRAIGEIVRRHETLRSRFPSVDGRATLIIEPSVVVSLEVEPLESLPEGERLAEATRLAREDAQRRFDLAAGPLFRVRLFRVGPEDHVLHIVMHHIISDGWSMGAFFKEMAALHGAFLRGEASPLGELTLQYADYARWQQENLGRRGPASDLAWWTARLGGDLSSLDLPTDRPRRSKAERRGAYAWFPVTSELSAAVGRLAQREGATRFQVLLSAFFVLLARHTGQDDLVIGTPTAGRGRREIEGLIGFFVNNLVLRADLSGDPTFRALLGRVRKGVVDAFAHQDVPFEKIVEALAPERELGKNPLFQVLFNHFVLSEQALSLPPFEVSTIDMTLDVSKFDLTLHCFEAEGALYAKIEYDSDLFDAETVRDLGERYLTLLRGVVADPGRVVSRLPILTDAERRRLLIEWNRTEAEPPAATSVHALFEAHAAKTPEAPALVFERERLTYAELDRRARALARRLVARGVGPETRVALFLDRSAELIVALLGVLMAGGAYVPIDTSVPPERVAFVLDDSQCRVVLTRAALASRVAGHGVEVLHVDAAGDGEDVALPAAWPGQLAYVIYTSGSTGQPKGVEVEHAQLLHYVSGIVPRLDVPSSSSYASVSTLAADLGHTAIFPALCGGGCLHLLSEERIGDGDGFAAYMREHAVDVLKIVPSHLEALLAAAARPADVLPRRLLVLGGEACSWELVERVRSLAPACAVMNHYGPAETTVGALTHRIEPGDRARFPWRPPVGRPLANTRIYLVDANLEPVPLGAVGELLISGGGVARGYRNRPELTEARFVRDPFRRGAEGRVYRTGDVARYTREGELFFVGRNDDQIKLRGYRVELGEVRTCIERHVAVAACAVLAQSDALGARRLVAYVVARAGEALDAAALRAFVGAHLPDYMVPAAFVFLDALPLTPNGKLDRRALPAPSFGRDVAREGHVAPRTQAEEILAKIWRDVLRIGRVGVHDNFFELGGESILSIQIISRANQAGIRLKPRDVFERATIAELCAIAGAREAQQAEQGPVTGAVPLTPIQLRFFEQDLAEPWHYNHAVLLTARPRIDPALLSRALSAIERHHDALRLRFARTPEGVSQSIAAPEERDPLELHDLSRLDPGASGDAIRSRAEAAQAGLDLARGPIWRALHFRLPEGHDDRLLLVIHHLAVDGVSWRVLLEDVELAVGQIEQGRGVELPPKTSSFLRWAERLVERAAAATTLRSAAFWLDASRRDVPSLRVDHEAAPGANVARDAQTIEVALDEAETARLLRDVPRAYRTQINDALLTALVEACAPLIGSRRLWIDLEGHGREDVFDDVDTSRTVGWFTSVSPALLDTRAAAGPGEALCLVKEQLRAIPGRGLDWGLLRWMAPRGGAVDELRALPPAEVGFNYMGRFDQSIEVGRFGRAPESPGVGTSLANRRRYLLDVGGAIRGERLRITWTWATAVHERATVEALADRFLAALRELIAHCTKPGVGGSTPSDFPLARLDRAELAAIEARYGAEAIEDVYVLSPLQRGMIFHSLAEPGAPAYVTQLALTLRGELSEPRFRRAWQGALDANPTLRTAFVVSGLREMHQVVCRAPALRWSTADWSALPAEEQRARIEAQARADREQGFDLADAPLMRLRLIRIGEDQHRFLWTHHHVLLDGWSLPLLVREVFDAYRSGERPSAPRRPFSEYIRWLSQQDDARAMEHWRALLSDWVEATPLPSAEEISAGSGSDAALRGIEGELLGRRATEALETLARREHLTLNTLVQAAWALLLARHSGREEVLFGVTVSGRPPGLPGVESMLGLFINTLPLRVDTRDAPLLPWLSAIQSRLVELQQLQASPLYEVQRLAAGRGSAPLFESLVVFENLPISAGEPLADAGLRIEDATDVSHATYPLALVVKPHRELHLELRYDARRFDLATIRRLLGHLRTLLEGMAAHPESSLSQLPMLTEEERTRQILGWNATSAPYPREATVPELFERQARSSPDAPALVFGEQQVDYADLERRADRLAACLKRRGIGHGDVVAIRMERGVAMVMGWLAILKAGGAYLPIDTEDPVRRVAYMLADSGARLLITQAGLATPTDFRGDVLLVDADGKVDIEINVDINVDINIDIDATGRATARAAAATDTAYLIYTSGSTGRPKGTRIAHRGITRLVLGTDYVRLGRDDRIAQASNASFDAATFEVWGALLNGACVVGIAKHVALSPEALRATLRAQRISVLFVTTALFNQLALHAPDVFAPLRYLLFGGEAVSPRSVRDVLERGRPQHLLHVYGPTECTTFSTWHEVDRVPDGATTVPIGRPIAHSTAYVLDRDVRPASEGAPGELYLGGDGLALGYHARPELTAERFVPDPFGDAPGARLYRTGDLVRRRSGGAIEFLGRIDQQVKLRGFRVELGEIEEALRRRPEVKDAVVLCREDSPGDKQLVAYVVAAGNAAPDRDALRAALVEELPDFMLPSAVVTLAALPLTPNGKVDRRALPAPEARQPGPIHAAPRAGTEERVAAIWGDVLGLAQVGRRDNFFDLGGHSLKLLSVHARLVAELGARLTITDLFQHTTVEAVAREIDRARARAAEPRREGSFGLAAEPRAPSIETDRDVCADAIAIVGMAGRFPGARDVESFWRNLCAGVESVRFFSAEELAAAGVPAELLADPRYVRARAVLDDPDLFDARFFGYAPREAELMDPQQRLFLECAWEACERAGVDPARHPGLVGVFAGASVSSYYEVLQTRPELLSAAGGLGVLIGRLNDFLTTRVSYKLNLRGPSVNVQTACSTSLVAVHEACRSLLDGSCDMALAGGVAVTVPWVSGYLHEASGTRSRDGHCRTFDARAEGMVSGNGVAVVVLKRLSDALADGDAIHAVIRGTAINNDGARKVGFTAPSIDGQAEVIARAQAIAGIAADSIGYVECHGTATALGDPIEVAALTRVFRAKTDAIGFCALASLKSNMGHLDAAAGVAGLIKAALAVEHGQIPPSLHYVSPNPEIDFAASPFYVSTTCREWTPAGGAPRRAGVSAFGLGGTNAHAVLEQPPAPPAPDPSREWQLLQLSARSETALTAMTARLAAHLDDEPGTCLADAAHTLRAGRREFEHRRAVLCRDTADAIACLRGADPERRWTRRARDVDVPVAFLFPGQGAQHVGMARDLYNKEPRFRETLDACFAILLDQLGLDLRAALYPEGDDREGAADRLTATSLAQPALFCIEYALAELWIAWGVRPVATLGHSVGELVSACLAGVMSLTDALRLVTVRGRLMERMPAGAMLAVPLSEEALAARLVARDGLWLAGVNAPEMCVVSGTHEAVEAFERELAAAGVQVTRLHTSHAFHSGLMDAAVAPFVEEVRKIALSAPKSPYVSTVTGAFITAEQATDPAFWGRQIRDPVRCSAAVARLLDDTRCALLEVGPGATLGSLARAHGGCGPDRLVVASMRRARARDDDQAFLLGALARLWTGGVAYDARGFAGTERRRRVALPTYPFERERYWIERRDAPAASPRRAIDDWFHAPVWRATSAPAPRAPIECARWLVLGDGDALEAGVIAGLAQAGIAITAVRPGSIFESDGRNVTLDPTSPEHARRLVDDCVTRGGMPCAIVHLWTARDDDDREAHARRGFFHLADLVRALGEAEVLTPVRITVVTSGVFAVTGLEALHPEKALAQGLCRVVALEHPNLSCRLVDVDASGAAGPTAERLVCELLSSADDAVVALRVRRRWVETFAPIPLPDASAPPAIPVRAGGTYLVTGGLGGMGLALARALHEAGAANLVLLGRTPLPERERWDAFLAEHAASDPVCRRIRGVRALEQAGAQVLALSGDVTDASSMASVLAAADARFGPIHGVIHAAGVPPAGVLLRMDAARTSAVLAPKVAGTRALLAKLGDRLDFVVLCSSLNAVKGFPGAAAYAAANAFLDAYARSADGAPGPAVVSIGWTRWRESGMAVDAAGAPLAADQGITDREGMEVLRRVLAARPGAHVLVSERDLRDVLRPGDPPPNVSTADDVAAAATSGAHSRPALATDFVAPATPIDREIAAIWEELFGIRPLGIHDDFFELGGHSLLAMRVVNRLALRYPRAPLSLRALFDAPTIAGLSARIAPMLAAAGEGQSPHPTISSPNAAIRSLDAIDPDAIDALSDDEVAALLTRLSGEETEAP